MFFYVDLQVPGTSASTGDAGVTSESSGTSYCRKRKLEDETNLEERISSLEKTAKVKMIYELQERVRTLFLQEDPSNALILLTLDELAKTARKLF